MRFDTPIFFVRVSPGKYNVGTGDYDSPVPEETRRYANVSDAGAETLNLVYGELRQGVCVIRLQNHYDDPFNQIRIAKKLYRVDFSRRLRTKQVFVVSEVQ